MTKRRRRTSAGPSSAARFRQLTRSSSGLGHRRHSAAAAAEYVAYRKQSGEHSDGIIDSSVVVRPIAARPPVSARCSNLPAGRSAGRRRRQTAPGMLR